MLKLTALALSGAMTLVACSPQDLAGRAVDAGPPSLSAHANPRPWVIIDPAFEARPGATAYSASERRRFPVPMVVPLQADRNSNQPLPTPGRSWGNALKSEKLPESGG